MYIQAHSNFTIIILLSQIVTCMHNYELLLMYRMPLAIIPDVAEDGSANVGDIHCFVLCIYWYIASFTKYFSMAYN